MGSLIVTPVMQVFDSDGAPGVGYKLYAYEPNSSTPKALYTNRGCTVEATNPVIMGAQGQTTVYGLGKYKLNLTTDLDVQVTGWPIDYVAGLGGGFTFTTIEDYANDLSAAITGIGSTPTTLYITGTATTSANAIVPSTLRLIFTEQGLINYGAHDLTLNGPIVAGRWQILTGTGTLTIAREAVESAAYPQWTGAVGDGDEVSPTDDADAINALADACRLDAVPIDLGSNHYYVEDSLNFTGANNDNGGYKMGWKIFGEGPDSTKITGNLASGYPIVDMADDQASIIGGVRIFGHASGSQICGLLHGMKSSDLATSNRIANVIIDGTYAEAGYINVSADLPVLDNAYITGPSGAIFTSDRDALGVGVIQSKYITLTTTPNFTLAFIGNGSSILGTGGDSAGWDSAIVLDEMAEITVHQSYVAQDGTAKAGILVAGDSGQFHDYHTVNFLSSRYENASSNDPVFVWKETDQTLGSCTFDGFVGGEVGAGSMFYFEGDGVIHGSKIKLRTSDVTDWAHFATRAGTGTFVGCEIFEQTVDASLKDGIDAALLGSGNIVHLLGWNTNWLDCDDDNIFITPEGTYKKLNELNAIGDTTSFSREFKGTIITSYELSDNTGPGGSDVTEYSYTLPGDLFTASDTQKIGTFRITAWGTTAANANAKTIKIKFGVSASETQLITNDVTGSPNNAKWKIEIDIARVNTSQNWEYSGKMVVGATNQTIALGNINANPATDTLKLIYTVDAAAADVNLRLIKLELL